MGEGDRLDAEVQGDADAPDSHVSSSRREEDAASTEKIEPSSEAREGDSAGGPRPGEEGAPQTQADEPGERAHPATSVTISGPEVSAATTERSASDGRGKTSHGSGAASGARTAGSSARGDGPRSTATVRVASEPHPPDTLGDTIDAVVEDLAAPPETGSTREVDLEAIDAPPTSGRLSRTLHAGEGGDVSYAEPLYDPRTETNVRGDPLVGLVVAERYRINERIGRGGMGIVYRVEHTRIGKQLAMKLLAGELSTNKDVVRRFKNEALTVSKLSSPHTVQVFDYGVWNHLTYLVMELVEGENLAAPLRRLGPMPFARLGRLMVQVCSSLSEAHQKGIVHRDIKPENIMIITDPRGVEIAKVLDFGLAKLREGTELNEVTSQGAVVGTPYYISPEQIYGEDVDGRTDIYSLGAVMFRALTGTYPFHAKTPMGVFTKHLTEDPPSANERAPDLDIPKNVSDFIQRCMAKDASDRLQTIEELREELLSELAALPLSSSDRLLIDDSGSGSTSSPDAAELRKKRRRRAVMAVPTEDLLKSQLATRKEFEAYERKLRRTRYGAWGLLALFGLAGAGGVGAYVYRAHAVGFTGRESEPNDSAAEANTLPFGQTIDGQIGRRRDASSGDRDFYHLQIPNSVAAIALDLTALPNIPICATIFRVGFQQPLAQFCSGEPSQDLVVAALTVDPGAYLVTVAQDPASLGTNGGFIFENVSDSYHLTVKAAQPSPTDEVEPNDRRESAQVVMASGEVVGSLAWVGDEDYYCLGGGGDDAIVWQVDEGERKTGSVVEATPMEGSRAAPSVRIHATKTRPFNRPRLEADVNGPWSSPMQRASQEPRCLRLRLTEDPWVDRDKAAVRPDPTRYTIRVLPGK